ncbi:hypothetical protein PR048_027991 [Dryococelus australis]|uniref:Uncharacterized protein n=1 Tax=Dryococelus australis TaxID=614101 RepID=A0ABQ9GI00_9NEOP|nr:hypothetical protein PR048_027991 [Dryococelus australis]
MKFNTKGRGGVVARPRRTGFDNWRGHPRIFACENRAGRCRRLEGFLGDLPFLPPFYSGAAPYSPRFILIGPQDLAGNNRNSADVAESSFTGVEPWNSSPAHHGQRISWWSSAGRNSGGGRRARTSPGFAASSPPLAEMVLTRIKEVLLYWAVLPSEHGSLPDFRACESGRTMPLVGVFFSRGSANSPHPFIPALLHTHIASTSSAPKTSMLRTTQTSSLTSSCIVLHSVRHLLKNGVPLSPSTVTADNQCAVDIGIFAHKNIEFSLQAPLMSTNPFSDWRHEVLGAGLVTDWPLRTVKGYLLAGLPGGKESSRCRLGREGSNRPRQPISISEMPNRRVSPHRRVEQTAFSCSRVHKAISSLSPQPSTSSPAHNQPCRIRPLATLPLQRGELPNTSAKRSGPIGRNALAGCARAREHTHTRSHRANFAAHAAGSRSKNRPHTHTLARFSSLLDEPTPPLQHFTPRPHDQLFAKIKPFSLPLPSPITATLITPRHRIALWHPIR